MKKTYLFVVLFTFYYVSVKAQNYALQFSTISQYVTIGAADIKAPWTTEMWVKKTANSRFSSIMTSSAFKLNIETWNTGGKVGITQKGIVDLAFNYVMPTATWTHLAFTCDGVNTYLFVNGELTATINATIRAPMQLLNNSTEGSLAIVDEVRVWSYAKSADDVLAEMNHPVSNDAHGLIGYWKFDDQGSKATDYSSAAHNGIIKGAKYVGNDNSQFIDTIVSMNIDQVVCSHENEFIIKPGSINQEVLCIKVKTTGSNNAKFVSSIRITPTGTMNFSDVLSVKIFYTGRSNVFTDTNSYGETSEISDDMVFTARQTLKEGTNYFWVTYDVSNNAANGNKLDAACTSVSFQDETEVVPSVSNPIGSRTIQNSMPANANIISIIPKPVTMIENTGSFELTESTQIVVDDSTMAEGELLSLLLKRATGYTFPLVKLDDKTNNISLEILNTYNSVIGSEGYLLDVTSTGISIKANTTAGIFYGTQTLRQLLPIEINSQTIVNGINWTSPNVSIKDYPRFVWRGLMLDVSRHFFSVDDVKKYIDLLALNKMNVFHWHLIDSEGFRIEIKSHPELTSIGALRTKCPSENIRYDVGFYTQDEIKDIVDYALAHHVNIEPELESPGHAAAWLAALPGLSCTNVPNGSQHVACSNSGNGGLNNNLPNTICMGKAYTYEIMGDVINEIAYLFPFRYVHIGGDEANHTPWQTCTDCQKMMQDCTSTALPLTNSNLHNVQTFYLRKIQRMLEAKGKKVVGWTEMGLLNSNSVLQDWIGGGDDAVSNGNETIYSNANSLYLDSYQGGISEPQAQNWMGSVPIDKIYNFNPPTSSMSEEAKALVLGIEACLWSEYNHDTTILEYRLLPRLYAVSEASWTEEKAKNFMDFKKRLYRRMGELKFLKYNYSPFYVPVTSSTNITTSCLGSTQLVADFGSDFYFWNDSLNSTGSSIIVNKSGVYKVYGQSNGMLIQRNFNITVPQPATQPVIKTRINDSNITYLATGDASTYKWYDSQTGNNLLNIGNTCTLPLGDSVFVSGVQKVALNAGLSFDKAGYIDFGNVTSLNGVSSFTFESWVKVDTWNNWAFIFVKEESSTSRIGVQLGETEGELLCLLGNGTKAYGKAFGLFTLGKWFHLAMVYNGNGEKNADRLKLYINGILVDMKFTGTIPETTPNNTASLKYSHPTNCLDGAMAESRFWSNPRTSAEIVSNLYTELSTNDPNLLIYNKLNEGSGQVVTDSKGLANGIFKNSTMLSWIVAESDLIIYGCESDRWCVGTVVGQKIKKSDPRIMIYPNPNTGSFVTVIASDKPSNYSIQWTDIAGRASNIQPSGKDKCNNQFQFIYRNVPKGIYLLRILNENEPIETLKVVVK